MALLQNMLITEKIQTDTVLQIWKASQGNFHSAFVSLFFHKHLHTHMHLEKHV